MKRPVKFGKRDRAARELPGGRQKSAAHVFLPAAQKLRYKRTQPRGALEERRGSPTLVVMKIPQETAVMTLPNATLFPQSLLPLYIFEPRYRQMLADALHSSRMFAVAMQRPGTSREIPLAVAGLGYIRVSVDHKDGTSHLIMQGLTRIELGETLRYKPYRVQRIRALTSPPCDNVRVDALLAKVRELLRERLELGIPFPFPSMTTSKAEETQTPGSISGKEVLEYLDSIESPAHAADLVSCAVLPRPAERQVILETVDVATRLKHLIHFLLADIRDKRKGNEP